MTCRGCYFTSLFGGVSRGVWWLLFTTMYTTRLPVHAYLFIRLLIGQDVWQTSIVPYYMSAFCDWVFVVAGPLP